MLFEHYAGIDYSGAQTPNSSLKGLRVYSAVGDARPVEIEPRTSPRKYWSRRGVTEWLLETLSAPARTIVGIDHGFSFPLSYFDEHELGYDWPAFLDDFELHWPTAGEDTYVEFVRNGVVGNGPARSGHSRWRRITESRSGGAKSVFHFDVPGSVAKSTHAGLPWLNYLRRKLGDRVQFWPFDGWEPLPGRSLIAEAYPSLWSAGFARNERTPDQHDAYSIAAWMQAADRDGRLASAFEPSLTAAERAIANIEGWILGIA